MLTVFVCEIVEGERIREVGFVAADIIDFGGDVVMSFGNGGADFDDTCKSELGFIEDGVDGVAALDIY